MRKRDGSYSLCDPYQTKGESRLHRILTLLVLSISIAGIQVRSAGEPESSYGVQSEERVEPLIPGKVTEGEITGQSPHVYQILLDAGQFLHLTVHQLGVDLLVTVLSPDRSPIVEVDSPNGSFGSEQVVIVAEKSGPYRLDLRPLSQTGRPRKYQVKIEDLRIATPQDKKWANAEIALVRAARQEGPLTPSKTAIASYEKILPVMQELGKRRGEAYTLVGLARTYQLLHRHETAVEYYNRAIPILREIGDRAALAPVMGNSGIAHSYIGNKREAIQCQNLALELHRILGDRQEEATTLNNLGAHYDSLGEVYKALDHYNQAISLSRVVGDRFTEATTLDGIGLIHRSLGQWQKALECFHQSLLILQDGSDPVRLSMTLNNIGLVCDSLGDSRRALDYYQRSLKLSRLGGYRRGEAITLNNIGSAYKSSGELQKALGSYDMALPILREVGARAIEAATLSNIGTVYESLGDKREALRYYNRSLDLAEAEGSRRARALALKNIGSVYASLGASRKALDQLSQSLILAREVNDRRAEAATLYLMARTKRDLGDLVEARSGIEAAVDIVESVRAGVVSSELRASYLAAVRQYYELYTDVLMRLDRVHPGRSHAARALHVTERGRARALLEMLAEATVDVRQGVSADLLEQERTLRQLLAAKAERQSRLLNGRHSPQQAKAMKEETEQLLTQLQEVEAQIKATSPRYAALTQPNPLTVEQIQHELLDSDTLMLEYALGDDRSYLWVVTNNSLASFELPSRTRIERLAKRVYKLLTIQGERDSKEAFAKRQGRFAQTEEEYARVATELSRMILGPAVAHLRKKRLLVVSDGALSYVPFAALPIPVVHKPARAQVGSKQRRQLLDTHEIVTVPSASTLAVLRREHSRREPVPGAVAIFADPVFDANDDRVGLTAEARPIDSHKKAEEQALSDTLMRMALTRSADAAGLSQGFPRLPSSRKEAEAIYSIAGGQRVMKALGFDANRPAAISPELKQYRFIHFATHGLLNSEQPELSGLVLSLVDEKGNAQNGFLRLFDVYNMDLNADLVVLSGCQTALGRHMHGEGLIGLTRGFMYAGASRVIASLWRVDDEATAELMKKFYEGVLTRGERPATALRNAQMWMRQQKRWNSPYYWAGFVLQGEWR